MTIEIETKLIKLINDLARIYTAPKIDQISKYVMEINSEDGKIYVQQFDKNGRTSVHLSVDFPDIEEDYNIPIWDSFEFAEVLDSIDDKTIELKVDNEYLKINTEKDIIELPTFDIDKDVKKDIKKTKDLLTSNKYGSEKCYFIGQYDSETEKPIYDAQIKIDLKEINLKKLRKTYNKGLINFSVKKRKFIISIGRGKRKETKNIERTIYKKDKKDPIKIKGECSIFIDDIYCINLLSEYEGHTYLDIKKEVPLVLKKVLTKERIGICYIISIRKEV